MFACHKQSCTRKTTTFDRDTKTYGCPTHPVGGKDCAFDNPLLLNEPGPKGELHVDATEE